MSAGHGKRPRGRPPKPPKPDDVRRRDQARNHLAGLDVWLLVRLKILERPGRTVVRACELVVQDIARLQTKAQLRLQELKEEEARLGEGVLAERYQRRTATPQEGDNIFAARWNDRDLKWSDPLWFDEVQQDFRKNHPHLQNAETLRRHYNLAERLRKTDPAVAEYCARELKRWAPDQPLPQKLVPVQGAWEITPFGGRPHVKSAGGDATAEETGRDQQSRPVDEVGREK